MKTQINLRIEIEQLAEVDALAAEAGEERTAYMIRRALQPEGQTARDAKRQLAELARSVRILIRGLDTILTRVLGE